jgi:CopG family transcriptional regulator, nickel-responsive regulator
MTTIDPSDKPLPAEGDSLARFGVSMEAQLLRRFDALIERLGYTNRSEAIRDLVRDRLVEDGWETQSGMVTGAVVLVFDHETRLLADRMTDIQHHHADLIVSAMHVHLDARNCMEVIVMKGESREVRALAQRMVSLRGVKHGRLLMTGSGD